MDVGAEAGDRFEVLEDTELRNDELTMTRTNARVRTWNESFLKLEIVVLEIGRRRRASLSVTTRPSAG